MDGEAQETGEREAPQGPLNVLTVDVEDYFQVSAFEGVVDRSIWGAQVSRVEDNTRLLLELFARHEVHATFFTLGWVAERYPDLLREIHDQGHEIASHGYDHRLVYSLTPEEFREDLRRASSAIQAAVPVEVRGFRAPSFSITKDTFWAYDVLREEGYTYSSSVFPVRHDRYGIPDFPGEPVRMTGEDSRFVWEVPMTTWRVFGKTLPVAGGGWLRLFPVGLTRRAIEAANAEGRPAIVYVHPWEFDPEQPRVPGASPRATFRHRLNLGRTYGRLERLLATFRFGTMDELLREIPAVGGLVMATGAPASGAGPWG